jgi:hypothetical protein
MILDTIARAVLPDVAVRAIQLADELPEAVGAARAMWDAGHGPVAAVRAFAAVTDGALDDAAVVQIEAWLATAIGALDTACAVGAFLAEHEPRFRSAIDATTATVFGWAYTAAATRDTLRRWQRS